MLGLTAETINAAGTLLDRAWIPIEIVVNHMPAEPVQVDALSHDLTAHKDVGEEWRVERTHQP